MSDCPDEADLLRLATGDSDTEGLAEHLDGCSPCRTRVDEISKAIKSLRGAATQLAAFEATAHWPGDASRARRDAETPEQIGEYKVIERLGSPGGQAQVYRAVHPRLPKEVAVKWSHRSVQPDVEPALLSEAKLLATLDHPGLVRIHDVGVADGRLFIVMDYVPGRDLSQHARRVSPHEAARRVAELARTLEFIHRRGIIHHDLKPHNIMIDQDDRTRLVDFGMAKLRDYWRDAPESNGLISGTPKYMAPEQIRGESEQLDPRIDIWAMGVILYELTTGEAPFSGRTREELFDAILDRDPVAPRAIDDSLPSELERIVLQCLAKKPSDRFGKASELAAALESWTAAESNARDSFFRSRRPWTLGVALVAAAILFAAVLGGPLARSDKDPSATNSDDSSKAQEASEASVADSPRSDALTAQFDVLIWNPTDKSRQGLSLTDPTARPLRSGDQIRITASVNQSGYLYLVWIDGRGAASPVYPWRLGDWSDRPQAEQPTTELSLPEAADEGWEMGGPAGMETLVLLARVASPVPDNINLRTAFADLPRQALQDPRSLVWLWNGRVDGRATRAPQFFKTTRIDDPVLRTQRLIQQRLQPHFPLIQAVSFAHAGKATD